MRLTAIFLIASAAILAQPPGPDNGNRTFEVASIKPNSSGGSTSTENVAPGRFTASNVTLGELIQFAFGIRDFQISGGLGWLRDDRYNVVATTQTPVELTDALLEPYLLSLLVDRCRFRYHRESKELQAYSLVVLKNGPRLTVHTGETVPSTHEISHGPGKTFISATNATMANLANLLNRELSRTVIDNTGLKEGYDIRLGWSPNPTAESTDPSLFTALQEQLGLKLESTKGPVDFIVIDNVERPSQN
jgi:uncharacterized protein (TIGR03435 family)